MLNLNKPTKRKPKPKPKTARVCILLCTTVEHNTARTVLIILHLITVVQGEKGNFDHSTQAHTSYNVTLNKHTHTFLVSKSA